MLFHLFYEMRDISAFHVFRYPSFRVMVALLTALVATLVLYPWFIRQLVKRQIGQVIREELDDNHQRKKNTPTMGGILLILAVIVSTLLWSDLTNPNVWIAVGITFAFSAVGFVDDAMKLGKRGSKGLSEKGKLAAQFGVTGLAFGWLLFAPGSSFSTELTFPFVSVDRFTLDLPAWLYLGFACFVVSGAGNSVNLTDGLDGLAIGPTILAAVTFMVLAYLSATTLSYTMDIAGQPVRASFNMAQYLRIPYVEGAQELAIFCAAIVGAGVGFLWYNTSPAQVFMGDVGSLGLGGALGTVAVLTKNELLSGIILGLFVVETVSVIVQRYSFRWTGKRVFLMAPFHHHLEKAGWKEEQIVVRMWIIALLLCLVGLVSLKLR